MHLFPLIFVVSVSLYLIPAHSGEVLSQLTLRKQRYNPKSVSVNFSYRNLTSIESDAFAGFYVLVSLDLAHNSISSLQPDIFHDLIALETLDLSHNKLTSLNRTLFGGLTNLTNLIIESNMIITIQPLTLVGLLSIREVCLFGNPVSQFFPSSVVSLCRSNQACTVFANKSCFDANNNLITLEPIGANSSEIPVTWGNCLTLI